MVDVSPKPILQGEFVRLISLSELHATELLSAVMEDQSTFEYTVVPRDSESMSRYIEFALSERRRGAQLAFAVQDSITGRLVGSTRFLDIEFWQTSPNRDVPLNVDNGDVPRSVEIGGTWYCVSAQRTVVNTESKLLLLTYAFDVWGVESVCFKTDSRNDRSRKAIERLGAQFEGIRRAHRLAPDGNVRDSAYFSIIKSEWPVIFERLKRLLASN